MIKAATKVTIWHNPRCSKSRATLALLHAHGLNPTERRYLDDAPNEAEIRAVLSALQLTPIAAMRTGEARFKALGLGPEIDATSLVKAMAANPVLIERPIVIAGTKARIGRPPEAVLELF